MRFYKGDIVEVINYWIEPKEIGNRYRLTAVRVSWDNETVIHEIQPTNKYTNDRACFLDTNIMLYRRPFINHLKDLRVRFCTLFAKTYPKSR
jgi:hypothetical protein